MSASWIDTTLGEVLHIKHGFAFKGEHFCTEGTHVVLTPGNFYDYGGFKHRDAEKYYSGSFPEAYILAKGDLLVAMTEQAEGLLGSTAFVPEDNVYLHNQRLGLVTPKARNLADAHFLYYLFNWRGVRQQIRATCSGAKVRHTSPSRIYETKVRLPPLPTQKKIAALLSAYDDLIENNERRIRILEEMAQNLYREWFVKFRFPGHKKVKMVDSPLGKIPQGWEVLAIGDLSEFLNRGVSPKYDDSSGLTVINQKCIRNGRLSLAESRKHCTKVPEGKGVRFGDVLINSTGVGTLGRVAQVYVDLKDCTVDSHVTIVRPASTTVNVDYFGFALCDMQPAFERMGAGATNQTELGRQRIAESLLLSPPDNLQKMFSEAVQPVRRLSMNLCKRNDALRQTRDLLLSKLISGEVDVSELDIRIPENAA